MILALLTSTAKGGEMLSILLPFRSNPQFILTTRNTCRSFSIIKYVFNIMAIIAVQLKSLTAGKFNSLIYRTRGSCPAITCACP